MKKIFFILLSFVCLSTQAQGSYALYDYGALDYVVKFNSKDVRSIASITKLFTANIVLRSGVNLEEKVKVNGKSGGFVPTGVYVSRYDLLRATIISSDNRAAETLANHHPGGFLKFIEDSNLYLSNHNLYDTKIVDSTGLLAGNVSTARDLIEFLYQIKDDPVIRKIGNERATQLAASQGKKTININLRNTNPDIFVYDNILISKTGFTSAAGRCVLMLVERNKEMYAVVVLGQSNVKNRSKVVSNLLSVDIDPPPPPKINSTLEFGYPIL